MALGMSMSVSPSLWSREKYPCLMDCYEIAQRYALFPDDESGWLLDCKTSRNMVHISMLPVPYIKRLWSSFNCSSWNTSTCLTFSAIAWQHWDGQPYSWPHSTKFSSIVMNSSCLLLLLLKKLCLTFVLRPFEHRFSSLDAHSQSQRSRGSNCQYSLLRPGCTSDRNTPTCMNCCGNFECDKPNRGV